MNASTFAQLLLLWQRELHRLDSFLQLHLALAAPSAVALGDALTAAHALLLGRSSQGHHVAMVTSSGFRNDVKVGENWFRLYTDSSIPVAQPNLQRISISKI